MPVDPTKVGEASESYAYTSDGQQYLVYNRDGADPVRRFEKETDAHDYVLRQNGLAAIRAVIEGLMEPSAEMLVAASEAMFHEKGSHLGKGLAKQILQRVHRAELRRLNLGGKE